MADLYSRLQELKKRKQTGSASGAAGSAARPGGDAPAHPTDSGTTWDSDVDRSPGLDWARISPGVYERTQVYPMTEGAFPFEVDQDGRWYGVSPLIGPYSGWRPIFLDVETSGLSGGAGSTAFLIGLGFLAPPGEWNRPSGPIPSRPGQSPQGPPPRGPHQQGSSPHGSSITVHQLFLSEPSAESTLLARYAELVGDPNTACYVTYNGASFDLPVLRTRHIMNRRRLPEARHWDLLPLTRRLYAPIIGSCTLGRVEDLVLGLGRDDDVPGSEVPARYHRFIDTGDQAEIGPVLAHHYYDVAHLVLLAATLQEILDEGSPERNPRSDNFSVTQRRAPHDRLALAKFLLHRGGPSDLPRCAALLDEVIVETEQRRRHVSAAARAGGFAARLTTSPPRAWNVSRELRAVVARRLQQWEELRELRRILWEVRGSGTDAVELAKVLEHRFKDYVGALEVIERWQETSDSGDGEAAHAPAAAPAAADESAPTHRAGRLRRKIARRESRGD